MPTSFEVTSSTGTYPVTVASQSAASLLAGHPEAHVIIDSNLLAQVKLLPTHIPYVIEATEDNKEYGVIADYLKELRELKLSRKSVVIAIGGGIIQDISCFICSIYMRGVPWHYLPTTLLGMVDSCIGGKSSINVKGSKNLVGTYYPPLTVLIDTDFIKTLQEVQIIDGLCEAIKICYAHPDPAVFEAYLALPPQNYEDIIALTLKTKKWFIEIDEFDQNERLLLNFGHTFGHAIEASCNYAISHGVAVGLGMLCAIAFRPSAHPRVALLETHTKALLARLPALPAEVAKLDVDQILQAFQADKKHTAQEYAVIVPNAEGMLVREKVARVDGCDTSLKKALQQVISQYGKI